MATVIEKSENELVIHVSCVIVHGNDFLLLRRSPLDKKNPGKWDLPGGRVKFQEDPEKAMKREIMEETSLNIDNITPISIVNHNKHDKRRKQIVQIIYLAHLDHNTSIKLQKKEHVDFIWIDKKDFEDVDCAFKDKIIQVLNKIFPN